MTHIKYKANVKHLGATVQVDLIDFKYKYVEVDFSGGIEASEYSFDDVELYRSIGLADRNGKDMYENDLVKYTRIKYTDCNREEIEEVSETLIGRLYFAEGLWFGIEFEDGTGSIFWAGTVDSEEFELVEENNE